MARRKKEAPVAETPVAETPAVEEKAVETPAAESKNGVFINKVQETKKSIENGKENPDSMAKVKVTIAQEGEVKDAYVNVRRSQLVTKEDGKYGPETNLVYGENAKLKLSVDTGKRGEDNKKVYENIEMPVKDVAASHEEAKQILKAQYEAKAKEAEAKGADVKEAAADKEVQAEA